MTRVIGLDVGTSAVKVLVAGGPEGNSRSSRRASRWGAARMILGRDVSECPEKPVVSKLES